MPKPSIDFKKVNEAALDDLDTLVRLVDPGALVSGDEWCWIDPQRESKKRGDSKINRKTGWWSDFVSGEGSKSECSVIGWWAHCQGLEYKDAGLDLATRYGLETTETLTKKKLVDKDGSPFRPVPADAPEPNWKQLGNPQRWAYLDAEGHLLRFHLRYDRKDGTKDFRPLTYRLLPSEAKEWRTKGLDDPQPLYGLDRLAQRPDAPVVLVEGEKTADAVALIFPDRVCITSGGCKSATHADWTPIKGRDLVIVPDNDEVGHKYAKDAAKRALAAGAKSARIVRLPAGLPEGWDLADQVPESMDAWDLEASLLDAEDLTTAPAEADEHEDAEGLPVIRVRPPEHAVAAQAQEALAKQGTVFQRRGGLVHVHRAEGTAKRGRKVPPGTPSIRPCTAGWLREQLSKAASFQRADAEGQTRKSLVPDWLPRMIVESSSHPGLAELTAVVETPVYLPGGRILTSPGLDEETGVFFAPLGSGPTIPDRPTMTEAQAARDRLFHVVTDFPWAGDTEDEKAKHRAAWLGFVLSAAARYAIQGPVPFVLIEANGQAAGKGLLAQVTGRIVTARDLPVATAPKDGVELRKMALPIISEGTRIQMLDEVGDFAGSREFNGLVTSTIYRDRVLGTSTLIEAPQNTVWVLCGNNVQLASDSTRRCLAIRLEPMTDRPEDREDFQHPDLLAYVAERASSLNADALTILKAFHCAGSPVSKLKPWGSFEAWARLVRDAVYWVTDGVDLDTRATLASTADTSRMALGQLIASLNECFSSLFTADQVLKRTLPGKDDYHAGLAEALEALNINIKGLSTRSVGRILARARRTVSGGLFLEQSNGHANGSALWRVELVSKADAA